jgi:hypothetical protein
MNTVVQIATSLLPYILLNIQRILCIQPLKNKPKLHNERQILKEIMMTLSFKEQLMLFHVYITLCPLGYIKENADF